MPGAPRGPNDSLIISYLALRTTIGVLGMALPFAVAVGAWLIFQRGLQESISAYYYTGTRGVFVGTLWAIGVFLFAYRGYDKWDRLAGYLACLFAIGASLFPTAPDCQQCSYSKLSADLHAIFATLLFLTLSSISLFLFRQTDPTQTPTKQKLQRNVVYLVCGLIMLGAIVLVPVVWFVPAVATATAAYRPVFWLESIAIVAFGVSWFTKGEAILADEE